MASIEQVGGLMKELGQVLALAEVVEHAESRSWGLTTRDGTILFVDLPAGGDRLWLSSEAGQPQPSDRERLYPLMLQYNALWQQSGGVRVALDGPEGAVLLAYDMPATGLEVPQLCTVFGNFLTMLDGWRKIVAGAAAAAMTVPAGAARPGHAAAGCVIRG